MAAAAVGSVPDRESSESVGEPFAQLAVKEHGRSELKEHESPENLREVGCPESFCSGTLSKQAVWDCGQHELKEHDSPESYRKAGAQHAVKEYGRSELKDREPPESFREAGCPESSCSGTVAKHAVKEHGYSDLQECESSHGFGEPFAKPAVMECGRSELKEHGSPENLREAGCPESFCSGTLAKQAVWECGQCELKERDSPESYEKAGAQHAVREHGQSELKDREPPESMREMGCPESVCSGTLAKHAVKEYGHSELHECDSSDAYADRVVEGWCRSCIESDPVSQLAECCRCEPCDGGKFHVCLPAVATGEVQPVAEAFRDPDLLDPFELAELEAELSAVEMSIRETLAGVSGRRMKGTRALLQRAVDMRALLVTRR